MSGLVVQGIRRGPPSGLVRTRQNRLRLLSPSLGRHRYLDVSVEPDDGDPAHSPESVLRSRAVT